MNKKSKIIFENKWISTALYDGWYVYTSQTRAQDGKLVAVIPFTTGLILTPPSEREIAYQRVIDKIYGHFECCPAHLKGDETETMRLTAIAGAVDPGDTPWIAAIKELEEEGGVKVSEPELIPLGSIFPTAACDTEVFLYGVDITGKEIKKPPGDGTKGESTSISDFVTVDEAMDSMSAYLICGTTRLLRKLELHHE
jgi:ADP-ribose pyrophosphatase YjhB (NUDIX family)